MVAGKALKLVRKAAMRALLASAVHCFQQPIVCRRHGRVPGDGPSSTNGVGFRHLTDNAPGKKLTKFPKKSLRKQSYTLSHFLGRQLDLFCLLDFVVGGLLLEPEALSPMPVFSHNFS